MNILMVERTFPWPQVSGTAIRVAHIARALAQLGEVDLFLQGHAGTPDDAIVPKNEPITRFMRSPRAPQKSRAQGRSARQLEWLLTSTLPYSIGTRDYSVVRSAFLSWARPHYDLAWVGRGHAFVPLDGYIRAPTIVDFDDLEDRKIEAWLEIASDAKRRAEDRKYIREPQALVRSWGSRVLNTANRRRWRALQHRIASRVDAVVVCSALDKTRLDVANSIVIPNGYAQPERPAGRDAPGDPPTIVLGGALAYAPNADAARFLAKEVLPRVRARIHGAQLRLVGRHDDRISELANIDGVTLTGFVPDMAVALGRADVVAAPIRFGSGTRVKILEAFAHRIPVVATTLGCEGIDVADGRHLLIANDADRFASACARLMVDLRLRRQLTAAAHELYWRRHRWEIITPTVVETAREVIDRSRARSSRVLANEAFDG